MTHPSTSARSTASSGRGQLWYVAAIVALTLGVVTYVAVFYRPDEPAPQTGLKLDQIPFNGARAYEHLKDICALGPRPSGSEGMTRQRELLIEHFTKQGAKVEQQSFDVRHPLTGEAVRMTNLIVVWHPERQRRVLLCAHYDTRPFPDRDPTDPRGKFIGANDGASGVALLMDLGDGMAQLEGERGVDFVLFDGEEFIFDERTGKYFLGSEFFAQQYMMNPPKHRYESGVLLDMVADANLRLLMEPQSLQWAPKVTRGVWDVARRLGVRDFVFQTMSQPVNDDHMPLNRIAGIPTTDIIDFDYPFWHTRDDVPEKCSALSLAKVGWVVQEWTKANTR